MIQSRSRETFVWTALTAAALAGLTAAAQQKNSAPSGPAPILMTVSETPQPGAEAEHAKLEAEYAAALDAGKGNQYYLGMGALTGTAQTVFLSGYSSLQEMADVHDEDETTMGEKLSSLDEEHSGTLQNENTAIWRLRPNLSNPNPENLAKMRYMELIHLHLKLGHGAEFADLIKQIRTGWMKVDPDFHYSIYQQTFGDSVDDSYLIVIPVRSLADLDKHHAQVAQYQKTVGEDLQKRMLAFQSADYNSIESNIFAFTPSMSRLPRSWTKDDADFWNPEPVATSSAKKTAKAK